MKRFEHNYIIVRVTAVIERHCKNWFMLTCILVVYRGDKAK